jgi:hypothetical protein
MSKERESFITSYLYRTAEKYRSMYNPVKKLQLEVLKQIEKNGITPKRCRCAVLCDHKIKALFPSETDDFDKGAFEDLKEDIIRQEREKVTVRILLEFKSYCEHISIFLSGKEEFSNIFDNHDGFMGGYKYKDHEKNYEAIINKMAYTASVFFFTRQYHLPN